MIALAAPRRTFGNARMIGLGYRPTYRAGACCPACGGSQWHVGRTTAECAICATALPIAEGGAA